jgi:hypothetical protein
MQKYIFGKASLRNLIMGILSVLIALSFVLFLYGYISGLARSGEDIIINPRGWNGLFLAIFGLMMLAFLGGWEIGRYAEMEFSKRRT